MICYSLNCAAGHEFDSWFRSSGAFDALLSSGQITCPACGRAEVQKSLMAPTVRPDRASTQPVSPPMSGASPAGPLSQPGSAAEQALADLRRHIEANSDYVGMNFAAEARRMHDGATPARSIHGEAKPEEARKLIEDGVPVAPLPFIPARKTN